MSSGQLAANNEQPGTGNGLNAKILLAGFGGQGVLFAGKFFANIGLFSGREVSWLPSYGPEMRGGTANCGVILSESPVGSPIVTKPDILVALNMPSLDKFEHTVVPGGHIFIDNSLVEPAAARDGVTAHALPAAKLAEENGLQGLANMIMAGGVLAVLGATDAGIIESAMKKTVPERKKALFEANMRAVGMGLEQLTANN